MANVASRAARTGGLSASRAIAGGSVAAFMIMMLARPDFYLDSARRGLALFATSVLPSLFPFYFCSLLLTSIGAAKAVSAIFGAPVKLLYGAPRESAYILFLSMLSGYPVGASMTAELYGAGAITAKEAKAIAAFASTSGPIFMLGTVGSAIFNDVRVGAVVLAAHYTAALLNGLIFRLRGDGNGRNSRRDFRGIFKKLRKSDAGDARDSDVESAKSNCRSASLDDRISKNIAEKRASDAPVRLLSGEEYDNLMAKTISGATLSMLFVGGYIVLGGMLADTLSLLGVDALLANAVGFEQSRPIVALLNGFIEMTRGCIAAADCSSLPLATAICAGVTSFGGLSVTMQNYTFLSRCKMRLGEILLRKICHAILAAGLGFALGMAL